MPNSRLGPLFILVMIILCFINHADHVSAESKNAQKPDPAKNQVNSGLDDKTLQQIKREQIDVQDAISQALSRISLMMQKAYDARLTVTYRGELDRPFIIDHIDLFIDEARVYQEEFHTIAEIQTLKLYDAYLAPGRHAVRIAIYARGPNDQPGTTPGYYAGCGISIHVREKATTQAFFKAEYEGDNPGSDVSRQKEPEGSWDAQIASSFSTRRH